MNCGHAEKCKATVAENEKMQSGIMDLCVKHANKYHDGHFTIMKFTTNWKFCFGTPTDRNDIDSMLTGKTLSEVMIKALLKG